MSALPLSVAFDATQELRDTSLLRKCWSKPLVDGCAWDRLGDGKTALLGKSAAGTLVGCHGEAHDVVDTVMWLLRAGFVSGETIHVEGGACHKTA
ncbi:hypothetical protein ACH4JS_12645 [Streptomyces sp. NPDC017638]|uniref:hypothetical protein n=1 Tax=Streptomyces sp. NPDC017638 TaxID=3365004 RepID=UPI003791C397